MIRIVTADEAARIDAAAIASGTPSFELMRAAGERATALIIARFAGRLTKTVIFIGPGNNGGDGWIVAAVLSMRGHAVQVEVAAEPRTGDAQRAAAWYREVAKAPAFGAPPAATLAIDALLGTGARGAPRGNIASYINETARLRALGVPVVSLDIPSGLDAATGADDGAVTADLTITFGTMKRGLLISRGRCGAIAVVDIGLGAHAARFEGSLALVDQEWVAGTVPAIPAESHKGIRRRICIVGGDVGMAGATILAARGAARSGVGMVRLVVHERSLLAAQIGAPVATAATWPADDAAASALVEGYAHAVLLGPGLGRTEASRTLLDRVLRVWHGPLVLDADALTLFAGRLDLLQAALDGRAAILTPHASECARLMSVTTEDVLRERFSLPFELAKKTGATVLLKGVPTVIAAPDGSGLVSAAGTPVLAAAGSGDVLGGIATTLLAQTKDAFQSAACAAWIHGRAAELANAGRPVRGVTLDDILRSLADVWRFDAAAPIAPVLAELPAVGDRPTGATVASLDA